MKGKLTISMSINVHEVLYAIAALLFTAHELGLI